MSRKTGAAERAQRRQRVAVNLLAGMNYREIAEALKVSPATVCRDTEAILEEWRTSRLSTADKWATLQLKRMDRAINAVWGSVLGGDLAAIDRLIKLIEAQAKVLGIDILRVEHSGPAGKPIEMETTTLTDDERAARLAAILEGARARQATTGGDA